MTSEFKILPFTKIIYTIKYVLFCNRKKNYLDLNSILNLVKKSASDNWGSSVYSWKWRLEGGCSVSIYVGNVPRVTNKTKIGHWDL